jgi:hypothetical protein
MENSYGQFIYTLLTYYYMEVVSLLCFTAGEVLICLF